MTDDVKPNIRVLAAGAEKVVPKPAEEKRTDGQVHGNWFVRRIVTPLVSGIALVASYGCDTSGPENTDSENDADVTQDVGEEADAPQEDAAPVEDSGPETDDVEEADSGDGPEPDADAEAEADAEPDVEYVEVPEDGGDTTETYDCTLTGTWTEGETLTGADRLCDNPYWEGSSQEISVVWEVKQWTGADCAEPETRSIYSYEILFVPAINNAELGCMHGDVLAMPGGGEGIVTSETGRLVTAPALGEATLALMGEIHDWGATENKTRFTSIVADDLVTLTTYNSEMGGATPVRTYTDGYTPIPTGTGTDTRGYLAKNLDSLNETVEVVYVELQPAPTVVTERAEGASVPHDGATYSFHLNTGTGEHRGLTLTRE